ncbi:MAG: thermonuclease family protein [Micavibrio sp.]|nr:thermonuclease family protein [Micavibrio sp.]
MMKQIIIHFIILASFFLATAPRTYAQSFDGLTQTGEATVIEVITPYTVQLDNGTITNLTGLNYPDYDARDAGEGSLLAMKILKDMLEGQKVRTFQTMDSRWGRVNRMEHELAHLQKVDGDLWVQGVVLSLGLAMVETAQRNTEMAFEMYALEKEARTEKLGIWAEAAHIFSPQEAADHTNNFGIVEGKIVSVAMNKNRLYMNFGQNWRDDFTVSIAPKNLKIFNLAGYDFLQWGGRHIRVRGWIEEYNGPHIEIDHPQAVEEIHE